MSRKSHAVLCGACADLLTPAVLSAPPDEYSALSRSVGERIGLAMTKAALAEAEQLRAETGAAPRGVNSLHFVRAAWTILGPLIDVHGSAEAAGLWHGLASRAAACASEQRRIHPSRE